MKTKENRTKETIWLGKNTCFVPEETPYMNQNIMVCGGTGCGKTVSIVEPLLMHGANRSSLIITMTKKGLLEEYGDTLRKRGYRVLHMDVDDPDNSTTAFDPLHYVRSYDDIQDLAQKIVMMDPRKKESRSDPFWDESSISLLSALIAMAFVRDENASMSDVLDLFDQAVPTESGYSVETPLDDLFEELKQKEPDHYAVRKWRSYRCNPIKTISCIYSTLAAALENLFSEGCRKMMKRAEILDLHAIAETKTALFVSTSPVSVMGYRYINLFWGTVFKELLEYARTKKNNRLPVPVRMVCDDFACGGTIPDFARYISIFRECGMSCVLILQSESQMTGLYGETDAHTIINNCDTYVSMATMDLNTASSVSKRMDIPVCEVLERPHDEVAVFRKGMRSVRTKRYATYEDEMYRKIHGIRKVCTYES